jgi:hypothetical protein
MAYDSPAEAASQAMIGYGSHFHIFQTEDSPNDWVDIGEVSNITPPSATTDMIDVTHMQSPDGRREFVPGLIDPGECSFDMNYIPGSVGDLLLLALLDLAPSQRKRWCRIIYPNGVLHDFEALIQTYAPTIPTDDKMTATVTFKVTGGITRGVDSPTA